MPISLPKEIKVFERGWLSANNILLDDGNTSFLIDSGYFIHAKQTSLLVKKALGDNRVLDHLVNTHLHSDHCGANAFLKSCFPELKISIPPGQANSVALWDKEMLGYEATGQICKSFGFDGIVRAGDAIKIGKQIWHVHAAAGHDPHSIVLFEEENGILISADALWENGFGVVFPELEGINAFSEVENTLELIKKLSPKIVIPGHGPVFNYSNKHIEIAIKRLNDFVKNPEKHAKYAAKVLIKFKLIEYQSASIKNLMAWAKSTSHLQTIHRGFFKIFTFNDWIESLLIDLDKSKALLVQNNHVMNL